jgi:hypothetical protein
MDPHDQDQIDSEQMDSLSRAFSEQLMACLDGCARGRHGLFSEPIGADQESSWPEAERLRELAIALQAVLAQQEFLDLCTMHGEEHPGERRLARMFLERIERGEVGTAAEEERRHW